MANASSCVVEFDSLLFPFYSITIFIQLGNPKMYWKGLQEVGEEPSKAHLVVDVEHGSFYCTQGP